MKILARKIRCGKDIIEYWYLNGNLYKIKKLGKTEWYQDRLSHYIVEYDDGTKCWYQDDQLSRIEYADGGKHWYQNGYLIMVI